VSGVLRTGVHGYSGPGVVPPSSMGGGAATMGYYQKVLGYGPLVYFPQWEAAGLVSDEIVNGWDGTYVGVTLGQPGIGDGNTSPFFDALNDFNNIFTAALAAAFDVGEGTLAIWARVNQLSDWTGAQTGRMIEIQTNINNRAWITKANVGGRLRYQYVAGGVSMTVDRDGTNELTWIHCAITWSVTANEMRAYFNGLQTGLTQVGLGVWVGVPIDAMIGCLPGPAGVWHGWLAHGAVWTRALAPGEIADLATV